jgi:DNA-binding TFAR19-related protein (PDSD5 family)
MEEVREFPQRIPSSGQGENDADDAAKRVIEEQMRRDMLTTLLDAGARERCMF